LEEKNIKKWRQNMKLWFFARTDESEYLYIRISDFYCTELSLNTLQVNKLPIFKVSALLFKDFVSKFPDGLFAAKVISKAGKYCFKQSEEIVLKESSFFTKDIFKKMPVIPKDTNKLDIIKICHKKAELES
jgi:hypothetical protein